MEEEKIIDAIEVESAPLTVAEELVAEEVLPELPTEAEMEVEEVEVVAQPEVAHDVE